MSEIMLGGPSIRPRVWEAFQWLQTEGAYPHGPTAAALCHVNRALQHIYPRSAGDRVLILGPGTQHEVDALSAGIDHNHTMRFTVLTMYAAEAFALREAGYDTSHGDVHDTDLPSESFDLIFSSNVLEHVFAPYIALMECRRLLRVGGTFYMVVPMYETAGGGVTPWHITCLTKAHWCELLNKCGFACSTVFDASEKLEGGAIERYHHIKAQAVPLQEPHATVMQRLRAAKGEGA